MGKNQYSKTMINKVAAEVARGRQLEELVGEKGFPPKFSTLFGWYLERPPFREAVEAARAFHAEAAMHQMVALTSALGKVVASEPGGAQAIVKGFGALRMAAERIAAKAPAPAQAGVVSVKVAAVRPVIQVISGVPGPNDPEGDYEF